ncbi:hypothetical protein BRPE64_ACDS27790 [Caballeronia insecticola]|uniref:Uncharacterized protein n=1 Tax=Caballeronia insecticola TaxID=758793 RepID=R4WJA4_9BURK|nr:hypothetical protein BRPE64_ACDS27790 [Caballeronia insecticola]
MLLCTTRVNARLLFSVSFFNMRPSSVAPRFFEVENEET